MISAKFRIPILLGGVVAIPIISSVYIQEPFNQLLLLGVPFYLISLILDLKSTISFGKITVMSRECSPLFAALASRGFKFAVFFQVSFEVLCGVVLLPMIVTNTINHIVSGAVLISFGVIHMVGYYLNTRGHTELSA